MMTEEMKMRAVEIADDTMWAQLQSHCIEMDYSHVEVSASALGLVDGNCFEVHTLAEADASILEAFEWLQARGYAHLKRDVQGEYIVLRESVGEIYEDRAPAQRGGLHR